METIEYTTARKLGIARYKKCLSKHCSPFLSSLDDLLSFESYDHTQSLGLIDIPLERITGTKTNLRTRTFADNFMPLLDSDSEFATKWMRLYQSHMDEGIREPIVACEYMNRYYVVEGNKRVSILKFSGASSVPGYVTRYVPKYSEDEEVRLYYEYMDFYAFSGMNSIYFSIPDSYKHLCEIMGVEYGIAWDSELRQNLESSFYRFKQEYTKKSLKSETTPDDAFLFFLKIVGYDEIVKLSTKELNDQLDLMWDNFTKLPVAGNVQLLTSPQNEEKTFMQRIFPKSTPIKCAFLYFRNTKTSGWSFAHEIGRKELEKKMPGEIETFVYQDIFNNNECEKAAEDAISKGCDVLFFTSPRFLDTATKFSVLHPNVKILDCALNNYSGYARTYYGRLYEAKHILGMLAGIMCPSDTFGYIADYPIAGAIAEINAFALGLKATNPNATLKLLWNSCIGDDPLLTLLESHVDYISVRETVASEVGKNFYGLTCFDGTAPVTLATPVWNWARFYERILRTVQNGIWDSTKLGANYGSLNYWWGMSSETVDIVFSDLVPNKTLQLLNLIRSLIISGQYKVFSGEVKDQQGFLHTANEALSQEDIIKMNWLCDNIVGHIPTQEELKPDTLSMMNAIGVTPQTPEEMLP